MPYADPEKRKQYMKAYAPSWAKANREKIAQKARKYRAKMSPEQKAKNAERNRNAREKKRIEEGRPKGHAHLILSDEDKRQTRRAARARSYKSQKQRGVIEQRAARARARYQSDLDYRTKVKATAYAAELRGIENLSNKYVARKMGLTVSQCPKDLLEAKRELIRAKRQLREQQQPDQQHAPES